MACPFLYASAQSPPLEGLRTYGCTVQKVEGDWRLEVHAEYANGSEWKLQLTRYPALSRTLKDCDKWMREVEKKAKTSK